jgi:16S rRNA pseudouridine516 synthase
VEKEYEAELTKDWDDKFASVLNKGIKIEDPTYECKPAFIKVIAARRIRLVITEGKYHQVKRMMLACQNEVLHLKRIRMGMLELDTTLETGECRPLTSDELELLQKTHD